MRRSLLVVCVVLALALFVGGCGQSDTEIGAQREATPSVQSETVEEQAGNEWGSEWVTILEDSATLPLDRVSSSSDSPSQYSESAASPFGHVTGSAYETPEFELEDGYPATVRLKVTALTDEWDKTESQVYLEMLGEEEDSWLLKQGTTDSEETITLPPDEPWPLGGTYRIKVVGANIEASIVVEQLVEEATDSPASDDADTDGSQAATGVSLSEDNRQQAASLGGTSQTGRTLWFVVVATEGSEAAAMDKRDAAIAAYAEEMYFIVEPSDHLDGFAPGYWLVVEALADEPDEFDLQWYSRVADDAYSRQATVLCDDPIPVVE